MKPKPFSALKNLTVPCATNTRFSARQANQFGLLAVRDLTQSGRRWAEIRESPSASVSAPRALVSRLLAHRNDVRLAGVPGEEPVIGLLLPHLQLAELF